MRRVRYAVASSLDGYLAGPKGEADWILMDPDIDFGQIMSQFDTALVGGRTYRAMAGESGASGSLFGMKTFVFSRTLAPKDHPGVVIVGENAKQIVGTLKKQKSDKDIWLFGGGLLFRSLAELGLVDSVEVAIIPILLGGGIPLLPPPASRIRLSLDSHQVLAKTGTVLLNYGVKRTRAKKAGTGD